MNVFLGRDKTIFYFHFWCGYKIVLVLYTFLVSLWVKYYHILHHGKKLTVKVEYHANENPLKYSEKIAYVGQRLMYPIIKKNYLTSPDLFKNAIKILGFYIKNSSF